MGISADLFQSESVLAYIWCPRLRSLQTCNDFQPIILQTAPYCAADCRFQPTSYHLKGVSLIRHRPPQVATGCRRPPELDFPQPPNHSNLLRSVLPRPAGPMTGVPSSRLWLSWLPQCIPDVTKGLQGAPQVSQGL